MRTKMGCMVILFAVMNLAGVYVVGRTLFIVWQTAQPVHWPTTPGVLTNLILKEDSSLDSTTYEVQVDYDYSVAGTEYHGSRLAFGYWGSSDRELHAEILEKLKTAKTVEVRYHPGDPATSALSFGVHHNLKFILAFALTWLAFVAGFTVLGWWQWSNENVWVQNLSVQ